MLAGRLMLRVIPASAVACVAISLSWLLTGCPNGPPPEPRLPEYDIVEVYDIATDSWTWLVNSPMPTPRSVSAAGVIDGKLYIVGGSDKQRKKVAFDSLEIFDPATEQWTIGETLPERRDGPGSAVYDGKLYVVGGAVGTDYFDDLFIYDPVNDSWSSGESMPTPRYCPAVGAIDGRLYVAGGVIAEVEDIATFEIYDIAGDFWLTTYDMPTARGQPAFGVIDDQLYVAGGFTEQLVTTGVLEIYDPSTRWDTTVSAMSFAIAEAAGVVWDGKLYIVGGIIQQGPDSRSIVNYLSVYDPVANTWAQLEDMPTLRSESAAGVIDGKIYVVGGYHKREKR